MHYFQFNIGDFAKKTNHLNLIEKGIYLTLLMRYYDTEKPLSRELCERITNVLRPEDITSLDYILTEFFILTKNGYINKRADEEIAKFKEKSTKARASIAHRWDTNVLRTNNERNTNHKPITNNHKPYITCELFNKFWSLYPRKIGKEQAHKIFTKLTEKEKELALASLPSYEFSSDPKYIPHASTWLNQKRWEDEQPTKPEDCYI